MTEYGNGLQKRKYIMEGDGFGYSVDFGIDIVRIFGYIWYCIRTGFFGYQQLL